MGWNSTNFSKIGWLVANSFNSQWDGILPSSVTVSKWISERFNSQRDGILPQLECDNFRRGRVSIPNGMEFYKSASDLQRCPHSVSIPNGMEFYERNFSEQRHQVSVSIPNGMEFYDGVRDGIDQFIRFQFPTGWNSTVTTFVSAL